MILFKYIQGWTRFYINGQQIPKFRALKNYGALSERCMTFGDMKIVFMTSIVSVYGWIFCKEAKCIFILNEVMFNFMPYGVVTGIYIYCTYTQVNEL